MTVDGIERRESLGANVGRLDDFEEPIEKFHCFVDRAQLHQRPRRQRGVTDPAVPIVPVADAPHELGQAGGRGGQDCAGGAVAERFEGERRSADQISFDIGQLETMSPVAPEVRGEFASLAFFASVGPKRGGAASKFESDRTAIEVDDAHGRLVHPG